MKRENTEKCLGRTGCSAARYCRHNTTRLAAKTAEWMVEQLRGPYGKVRNRTERLDRQGEYAQPARSQAQTMSAQQRKPSATQSV